MAHVAPASTARPRRPFRRRTLRRPNTASWALAATLGVVYGLWAFAIERHAGPITSGNVIFGVVCGVVVGVAWHVLHMVSRHWPDEPRAAAWAVFTGLSFGFLYSQTDASVLRCVGMGLAGAIGVLLATYYRYHTAQE